jgi:peptidoglycan/xylan/chitin deacetylase (PgdA/CDA1 family)
MTVLKHLAIVAVLLGGGAAIAIMGFLARQDASSERAPAAERSAGSDQVSGVSASRKGPASGTGSSLVTTVQAVRSSSSTPSAGPARIGSGESATAPTGTAIAPCDKPDALGLSRVVQIDTAGGPEFGLQHFRGYESFLRDHEVVLTFDDGPWPVSTAGVLKALADQCVKATFFEIGEYARWRPEITRQVIDAGMTVGTHTWSHKDLARNPYASDPEKAEQEIEMGASAVHSAAAGGNVAPFFRFPDLVQPPQLLSYLAGRNIAVFSTDIDSRDFTMHKPAQVVDSVMSQLAKWGKGIVLLHDFHRNTADAMPELLRQLKVAGYKVVHMVPKDQLTTIAKYDEMLEHRENVSSNSQLGNAGAPATQRSMYMYVPAQSSHKKSPPAPGVAH